MNYGGALRTYLTRKPFQMHSVHIQGSQCVASLGSMISFVQGWVSAGTPDIEHQGSGGAYTASLPHTLCMNVLIHGGGDHG